MGYELETSEFLSHLLLSGKTQKSINVLPETL